MLRSSSTENFVLIFNLTKYKRIRLNRSWTRLVVKVNKLFCFALVSQVD